MLTKQDYIESLQHEFRVIRHLFEQAPTGMWDYRPTEKQRSTRELLAYLATIGGNMMNALVDDGKWSDDYTAQIESITPENFIEKIIENEQWVIESFNKLTDEDLVKEIDLFGMKVMAPKRKYLGDLVKVLVAYKMQLFLYIKSSGNQNIGTSDLWGGFSMNQ